jgi:lipid-A-disaccharide synthase
MKLQPITPLQTLPDTLIQGGRLNEKRVFLMAGEASGDEHGSKWVAAIKSQFPDCDLMCWGGDKMESAGATLLSHYKNRNIMGLVEVLKNLKKIKGFLHQAQRDIAREKPDILLCIDNPGFNLPLATYAKSLGIEVHWYIAPKAWAWNTRRIKTMKKVIDYLYVIFPFEVAFFASYGMPSVFVGNPTERAVSDYLKQSAEHTLSPKTIALLPGSRPAEVKSLLPNFIKAVHQTEGKNVRIWVAGAPSLSQEFYENVLQESQLSAEIRFDKTFDIVHTAAQTGGYALVASGTATLETALLGCPQLVAYKVSPITFFVGKYLFGIRYVSLVNILLQRAAVQELLQDVSVARLSNGIQQINTDGNRLQSELRMVLSNP